MSASFSSPSCAAPIGKSGRDMVWIPAGSFVMGSDCHYPEERPARRVACDGFWIDRTPVTNREFARFVEATGYVSFAEHPPRQEDYPNAPPENLKAGSMVFQPTSGPVPPNQPQRWWDFVLGADWRHPAGPQSALAGLDDHPVVHVAVVDVEAYAQWTCTSMPTEKEWEFAAWGGLEGSEFAWGNELHPGGKPAANTWQGRFPYENTIADGWVRTSPVGSYPSNGYGLHDMIGNVWEFTADWWSSNPGEQPEKSCCTVARKASADPTDPLAIPRRVLKGGSHLCAPNYCRRYRPPARHPHPIDTSTSHIGFRCVVRPET